MAYRNYSPSNGFIVDKFGNGDFSSVDAASTAATSGMSIFINPGTYTEDVTLKPGVYYFAMNFSSVEGDGTKVLGPTVIKGKCSLTSAGSVVMTGLTLQTNGDYCLSITGSADSNVILNDCNIDGADHGAIIASSTGGGGIVIFNSLGDQATTDPFIALSGTGGVSGISTSFFTNSGSSLHFITAASHDLNIKYSEFFGNLEYSGTSAGSIEHCVFELSGINVSNALTGTALMNFNFVRSSNGTAASITIGATANAFVTQSTLGSTNAHVITGTGNIYYGSIVCTLTAVTLDPALTAHAYTVL